MAVGRVEGGWGGGGNAGYERLANISVWTGEEPRGGWRSLAGQALAARTFSEIP